MTLVETAKQLKTDYNAAIDSAIKQINDARTVQNAGFDAGIDQLTKIATDFPASLTNITAA